MKKIDINSRSVKTIVTELHFFADGVWILFQGILELKQYDKTYEYVEIKKIKVSQILDIKKCKFYNRDSKNEVNNEHLY